MLNAHKRGEGISENDIKVGNSQDNVNLLVLSGVFRDNIFLHFCASMISGLVTTAASMPVDIAKTRLVFDCPEVHITRSGST